MMGVNETVAMSSSFDDLVAEALRQDFSGWDFAYMRGRWLDGNPSWDYRQIAYERSRKVEILLDMGTGGGELLSTLAPLPPHTFATEGFPPNVPVAHQRLDPLGVQVVPVSGDESMLPFADQTFDLVLNRHESFHAPELHRILKPGASFITQQVGGRHGIGLNEWFQDEVDYEYADWSLDRAVAQLESAGLQCVDVREEFPPLHFLDIGAVVFYLKVIAWQIADFGVESYHDRLLALHHHIQETGAFRINAHYFYVEARK